MRKLFRNRLFSVLLMLVLLASTTGIQALASETSAMLNGLTKFVFDGNSVTVTEGTDTNYEVVVYDSTDTEIDPVVVSGEDSTTYSVPEGSEGELLVSVKKKGGAYVFEGEGNGAIAVKKEATADAVLYLNGLDITSSFTSVVQVKKDSSATCTIYVVDGTENTLTDNSYNNDDIYADNAAAEKAVMKFKDGSNVIFDGAGVLNIKGNAKNGIKANNLVTFNGEVTYNIDVVDNGISSDNSIIINSGTFNVKTAEGDGVKAGSDTEPVGDIIINGGELIIDSYADGIQATANLTINGGLFDITTYGGYTSTYNGDSDVYPSAKALKASGSYVVTAEEGTETEVDNTECYLNINGGTFYLNCPDDAIHSDKDTIVSGGIFTINTADDAFHAEYVMTMGSESSTQESLQVTILHSYEGIEGAEVNLYDGYYRIYSSDDCVNAANGDLSRYTFVINVYGGDIYASTTAGDCFDSNTNINIFDGKLVVLGAITSKDANSPLDCDGKLNITGGTVLEIGLSQMAVTPATGQAYVAWTGTGTNTATAAGGAGGNWPGSSTRPGGGRPGSNRPGSSTSGSITNGDTVTITDASGNELFSVVAFWDTNSSSSVNYVLFSSADIVAGSSYTLTVSDSVTPTMIPTVTLAPVETATPGNTDEPVVTATPEGTVMPSDMPLPPSDMPSDMPLPPSDMPTPPGGDEGGFYYGDINMSKTVDAVDALAMLKHAAKIELITDGLAMELADVNHDGVINAEDALEALKIAAKIREAELHVFMQK